MSFVISPNHLEFPVESKDLTQYLTLTNTSGENWAFKVKTTAPKLYSVKPSIASIEPGSKQEISIVRLGNKVAKSSDSPTKSSDKFLILYAPVGGLTAQEFGEDTAAFWSHIEDTYSGGLQSKKVRVVLDYGGNGTGKETAAAGANDTTESLGAGDYTAISSPARNGPGAVPSGRSSDVAPAAGGPGADLRSRATAASTKDEISSESKRLKEGTATTKPSSSTTTTVGSSDIVPKRTSGIPLTWALFLVFVAFFVGWRFV